MRIESLQGTEGFIRTPQDAVALQIPPDFIETLPIAIYACDAQGRLLWFNKRAADLWGRTPLLGSDSELYCGSHRLYLDGRQIARAQTPMAAVLRTGIPVRGVEGKLERPDGTAIWVMVHIEPIEDEDGRVVGAINCFHDVTDRRLSDEIIGQQEQRLAATYQHAAIGIAEVNAKGELGRVNGYLADLLGYSADELVGRSVFDATLAENVDADLRQFERQVRGEIDSYRHEKRFIRKDGARVWVAVTSSSVRDSEGRFLYAVRVQQDITARKKAEAALVRHLEQQAALYEFTDSLQRAANLGEVHEIALSTIIRALGADRASILFFDNTGFLRFAASRGLSQAYRTAVEGHSPWSRDTRDPEPIAIADVEQSGLPDDLKAAVRDEGIAALAFIPISVRGQLLGKFMSYYDHPHDFVESELRFALTVAGQLGFAVDRVRLETARQTTERAANQLVAVVESSHDAIISKDLNGIIASWNASAERLFGFTADEAIGRHITMIIPDDRLGEEPEIIRRISSGENVDHFETVRRRKDGNLVDISLTISPIRNSQGRIIGASKIARDITDQKMAEAKLRASERQLRDLLAAIPAAIYTTDADGTITFFNEAAVELSGRVPQIGKDKWCVTWKLFWPDGSPLPHDQCPMAVALKEGRPIRNAEAVAERPDGVRIPFIPYPTPLRDEDGKIVGGINMLVDISERKQAETQQRLLFNELNHRVKNNMQMLQSLLSLAGQRAANPQAREILREAGNRVAAMAAAQQVLYETVDSTQFNAKGFLLAVCGTIKQTFPKEVAVEFEADDAKLSNDVAMPLALILNELLTNAIKYGTPDGAGTIRVGLRRDVDGFQVFVEDSGPGFDLASVRDRSSGLKLVQGLARQLHGKLVVTKEPKTRCSIRFS
ncbi:MAG: PAS domain S-box protein [Mesorhizobium sp.]|uniref:PAS domain S-box protein n=3 Tax=Mesorhizobium TaxID=68287 RepID=UPI000FD5E0C9|nr:MULTISPECIES: PAS domain S-box protein [unclassified Mesorhizobium]MCT2580791.1 PAS domain S-box protein [Mesorhizobium sp. P13.3]MDF3169905.1 PAS domain S-box protein [Mesorhizobium sp. P16.1]MDF3179829.1 PAS domain S-box protein [Mesorhizobium sp. P17.1]MDF3186819.1 PAS domain S-box protein [Mesorhizobium sp. ICCV3110.1]RUV79368.1 PAS domain S-box protein [Mesorhizobium sp. M1A.F.Ca.IN.020.30.1.1]